MFFSLDILSECELGYNFYRTQIIAPLLVIFRSAQGRSSEKMSKEAIYLSAGKSTGRIIKIRFGRVVRNPEGVFSSSIGKQVNEMKSS